MIIGYKKNKHGKGMTLAELLIFMFVFLVFIFCLLATLRSIVKAHRFGKSRIDVEHNAAISLDFICKDLVTANYVGFTGSATPPISLSRNEIIINYSKPSSPVVQTRYKVAANNLGIKQLLRSHGTSTNYEVVSDYIDDVIIAPIYTPDPYGGSPALYESYRVKVVAKSKTLPGVPDKTFSLISQITPRACGIHSNTNNLLTPVEIYDYTNRQDFKIKLKPSL